MGKAHNADKSPRFWDGAKFLILPLGFVGFILADYAFSSIVIGVLFGFTFGALLGAALYWVWPSKTVLTEEARNFRAMAALLAIGLALLFYQWSRGKPELAVLYLCMMSMYLLPNFVAWRKAKLEKV